MEITGNDLAKIRGAHFQTVSVSCNKQSAEGILQVKQHLWEERNCQNFGSKPCIRTGVEFQQFSTQILLDLVPPTDCLLRR